MKKRTVIFFGVFIRFLTGSVAAVLIMCGSLSLLCTFRTGARAFASHDLIRYRPDTEGSGPGLYEMAEINPDTAAWLTVYETNIDYPVLQGRTDMEYINKDAYGTHSISGSIFLSALNQKDFSEPYQIIYGHNMENGSMLGDIDEFTEEEFFFSDVEEVRGLLITENNVFDLYVFAILRTDAYDPVVYKADRNEEGVGDLINYIKEKAMYSVDAGETDHVIALSTCDGGTSFGRNVLFLKAVKREGTGPIKEVRRTKEDRIIVRTPGTEKPSGFAFTDVILLIIILCLAFPYCILRKRSFGDPFVSYLTVLLSAAVSLAVFIVKEDLSGRMTATDVCTPLFIMAASVSWLMRYCEYRRSP